MPPTGDTWHRDPHTGAKHDLLRRYLQAWLPILFQTFPRITYAEGFAGPGIYTGGEPGSPVVALEVMHEHRQLLASMPTKAVHVVLVEEKLARQQRLVAELEAARLRLPGLPPNVVIHEPVRGDSAIVLPELLTDTAAWGPPMLVFLDSFGGPDIRFDLLRRVAANRAGEVIATLSPSFLTRHGSDPTHAASGDEAFGGTHWQQVLNERPQDKHRFLINAYRQTMHLAGFAFVLAFEMVDEGGRPLALLFATNNRLGLEKMKDAMWLVDPIYGIGYRDPRDPAQLTLDIGNQPDTAPLAGIIRENLSEEGSRTVDDLRRYALLETVYRPQHVLSVVRHLRDTGFVATSPSGRIAGPTMVSLATTADNDGDQLSLL